MKTCLRVSGAIALLAIASLCLPAFGALSAFAHQAPAIAWNVRAATWNAATAASKTAEAFANVERLTRQLADEKTGVAAQLRGIRKDFGDTRDQALAIVNHAMELVDRRAGDSLGRADAALTRVDGVIAIAGDLRDALKPTLDNTAGITRQVNEAAPLFLDCEYNQDCLFNRYQGASKAFERGMQRIAEAMSFVPKMSEQFTGIVTDAHKVTTKFTGPRSTKAKIWDGIKTGALAARFIP